MKEFKLKELFSIVDGRLSTEMNTVYDILNTASGESLTTIALPIICDMVKKQRPKWYVDAETDLNKIKERHGNVFNVLMHELSMCNKKYVVSKLINNIK